MEDYIQFNSELISGIKKMQRMFPSGITIITHPLSYEIIPKEYRSLPIIKSNLIDKNRIYIVSTEQIDNNLFNFHNTLEYNPRKILIPHCAI